MHIVAFLLIMLFALIGALLRGENVSGPLGLVIGVGALLGPMILFYTIGGDNGLRICITIFMALSACIIIFMSIRTKEEDYRKALGKLSEEKRAEAIKANAGYSRTEAIILAIVILVFIATAIYGVWMRVSLNNARNDLRAYIEAHTEDMSEADHVVLKYPLSDGKYVELKYSPYYITLADRGVDEVLDQIHGEKWSFNQRAYGVVWILVGLAGAVCGVNFLIGSLDHQKGKYMWIATGWLLLFGVSTFGLWA